MCTRRTPSRLYVPLFGAVVALAAASPLTAGGPGAGSPGGPQRFHLRVGYPTLASYLLGAVMGAADLLEDPRCQRVFDDFADGNGASLASVLRDRRVSGRDQLGRIFFYDGSRLAVCRKDGPTAATAPGSSAVFVCPSFQSLAPRFARAIVIHELLHTLGLGENPPSSQEITQRVMHRCRG